jgi:hypothetical protein
MAAHEYGIKKVDIDNVMKKLNVQIKAIRGRTQAGLTAAGQFVRAEAQKQCPVDTGNLRNSAYVVTPGGRTIGGGKGGVSFTGEQAEALIAGHQSAIEAAAKVAEQFLEHEMYAEIGFTAFYAVFVHEIQKNYTVGDWKYLERALYDNQDRILKIIADRAKVRK